MSRGRLSSAAVLCHGFQTGDQDHVRARRHPCLPLVGPLIDPQDQHVHPVRPLPLREEVDGRYHPCEAGEPPADSPALAGELAGGLSSLSSSVGVGVLATTRLAWATAACVGPASAMPPATKPPSTYRLSSRLPTARSRSPRQLRRLDVGLEYPVVWRTCTPRGAPSPHRGRNLGLARHAARPTRSEARQSVAASIGSPRSPTRVAPRSAGYSTVTNGASQGSKRQQ